ncbi:hypothetical protein YC2023_061712 [Brassica napus]
MIYPPYLIFSKLSFSIPSMAALIINEDGGGGLDSRRNILEINCSRRVGRLEQSMMRNQSFSLGLRLRSVRRSRIKRGHRKKVRRSEKRCINLLKQLHDARFCD